MTSHQVTAKPTPADSSRNSRPPRSILLSALSTIFCTEWAGLEAVSTPATRPSSMMGAETYMTLLASSFCTSRVVRAPYSPRSVRYTSRQRE